MRYARVETVMEKEPALRRVLSAKDVTVFKPNGEKQDFCKEVIAVTDAIHEDGLDAHSLSNQNIIGYAARVVLSGKPLKFKRPEPEPVLVPVKKAAPAKKPAPVAKKAEKVEPAPAKKAAPAPAPAPVVKKVAPVKKAESAPVKKVESAPAKVKRAARRKPAALPPEPVPEETPEPEAPSPKAESVAAPIAPVATDGKSSESSKGYTIPRQTADGVIAYYPSISCVCLLVSISQLLEHFMAPGPKKDEFIARADAFIVDLKKIAVIPKPNAKEAPPAVGQPD